MSDNILVFSMLKNDIINLPPKWIDFLSLSSSFTMFKKVNGQEFSLFSFTEVDRIRGKFSDLELIDLIEELTDPRCDHSIYVSLGSIIGGFSKGFHYSLAKENEYNVFEISMGIIGLQYVITFNKNKDFFSCSQQKELTKEEIKRANSLKTSLICIKCGTTLKSPYPGIKHCSICEG